ncbi:MAG: helix-turn-helix transcriptional regulator [Candidatus Ruthia sp.]|nr:helix-turn-helix transcriptional regulator [Candidatus Ruthturnera sp.]MBT4669141.1 helix-turn-helix transcriptional regulator [Candidatus Ruthturnera sp.]MBT7557328.1 helix-turn-helix transcriptional regulator [Candidatus Woesearchaeota archaeon]
MKLHEIGPNIKTLRKAAKLTQSDLADLAGISRVTYGRLERGEIATVSIKTIDIVLSALDYEIDIKAKEAYGIPVLE